MAASNAHNSAPSSVGSEAALKPAAKRASTLASTELRVRLINATARPLDNAVATARTCYAPRVVTPEDVGQSERSRAQRDRIAESTYAAGHHTTLQHAQFQFTLEGVSRQAVWSFLHAHPHGNSEQVSQRYVAVRPEQVYQPELEAQAKQIYQATVVLQMAAYQRLVVLLTEPVAAAYFQIFRARKKQAGNFAKEIQKRAQEIARYALPVATLTHLYHTISGLTLHRYHRLCRTGDVPRETEALVEAMVAEVHRHDPEFLSHLEDPLALEATPEHAALSAAGRLQVDPEAAAFAQAFDAELGGQPARLVASTPQAAHVLAQAVRATLGLLPSRLSDAEACAWALAPERNKGMAGALNLTHHTHLGRTLEHVHCTFQKKLSHCADAQAQRHRSTPGSRPILMAHYSGKTPDLVVPQLIAQEPEALDCFRAAMQQTWTNIDTLLDLGVAPEQALYLLPNAFPIRFYESGSLAGLHHKWTTRLCYNAQEEIWRTSLAEVQAFSAACPELGQYFGPPCSLRQQSGTRPICPEGSRYCGVPVWKLERDAYTRLL